MGLINKYTVVQMNEGNRQFRISTDVGERIPVTWTASGRLLLGHMSDTEILEFVPEDDFILPDGSQLQKQSFIDSIRKAEADGFFSFDGLADTYTHCFAAPVFDGDGACTSTLCLIAPKEDARQHYARYRETLINSATKLTASLAIDQTAGKLATT